MSEVENAGIKEGDSELTRLGITDPQSAFSHLMHPNGPSSKPAGSYLFQILRMMFLQLLPNLFKP